MKKVKKKFKGQLSGQKKKESFFKSFCKDRNISLPKAGKENTVELKEDALNGAFLSILDGRNSLKIDGEPVSKIKVYNGEIGIPKNYTLSFTINRISKTATKLSAELSSK